ncbi:hypothetical protein [Planococcus maritimus]|uniref:hypothetical protein n=1 Tax=Planococcus maritimus TaxID=192421 RepID=UPI000AA9108F|nr:hypothetical protein [Planococcus maritimus]
MISILKVVSLILLLSPALLIYTEMASIPIAVILFLVGALLYTYTLSKKRDRHFQKPR